MGSFKSEGREGNRLPLTSLVLASLLVYCEVGPVWARESVFHQTSQRVMSCPRNCEACNGSKCTSCLLGYLLNKGDCLSGIYQVSGCSQNCLKCGVDQRFCETCEAGFDLNIWRSCVKTESTIYSPSDYGTRWDSLKPSWQSSNNYHSEYDTPADYGYGVHFGGIFLLPCLVVVYILRALGRSRESRARALANSEISPVLTTPEVSLQSMPPPMTVAQAEFDDNDDPSEQDRLLGGREEMASSDGAVHLNPTPGATVLVIDPEGNIEVGKEEKV